MNKSDLRAKFKNIRNNINDADVLDKSEKIYNNLINTNLLQNAKCVFIYLAYGREVKTDLLLNYLSANKVITVIPKCDTKTETMIPVVYTENKNLKKNIYGINEIDSTDEYTNNIDAVIVPGICFDKYGNRIGYGKGYYDKYLDNKNILKIGLCYDECLFDNKIPSMPNDITMDYVITDREVFKIKP